MKNQPTLPPEAPLTDAEQVFISESPPNLWPSNQNSNLGTVRKVFTDTLQEAIEIFNEMFLNLFAETATTQLDRFEFELGIPILSGYSDAIRRRRIELRMRKSRWTNALRKEIIENFLAESLSFGKPTRLTPAGVALTSGGVTLYAEPVSTDITELYEIIEDIPGFTYTVVVDTEIAIDVSALELELRFFTPAHIDFEIARSDIFFAFSDSTGSVTESFVAGDSFTGTSASIGEVSESDIYADSFSETSSSTVTISEWFDPDTTETDIELVILSV